MLLGNQCLPRWWDFILELWLLDKRERSAYWEYLGYHQIVFWLGSKRIPTMYGTSWSSPEPGTSGTLPRVILTSSARAAPPLLAETGSEEPSAPDDGTALLWSQRRRERLAGAVRRGDRATDVITAVVGSLATRSSLLLGDRGALHCRCSSPCWVLSRSWLHRCWDGFLLFTFRCIFQINPLQLVTEVYAHLCYWKEPNASFNSFKIFFIVKNRRSHLQAQSIRIK